MPTSLKLRQTVAGTATIPINSNTVTVTHGMGVTPTIVMMDFQSQPGKFAMHMYISAKSSTTFTIMTSSNVSAATTVGWLAII